MSQYKFKILSWNFGKQNIDKLNCITNNLFKQIENNTINTTIYVIGLQEVSYLDIIKINNYFKNNKPFGYEIISGRKPSSFMTNYDLLTYIIYPIDNIYIQNIKFTYKSYIIR